jgi:hypothetical protein
MFRHLFRSFVLPKGGVAPSPIVRAGGAAAFDPDSVAGLTRWYKADAITGLNDGDAVATWTDSSASAANATQGTGANKPTYKTGIVNGLSVVRFDGLADFLNIGDLSALTAGEAFIVVKLDADPPVAEGGLWQIGSEQNAATQFPFPGDGVIYDQFGTSIRKSTVNPATTLAQWNIYSVYSAANDWQSYLNGVSISSTVTNTVGFDTACLLGRSFQVPATTLHLKGDIAEFLLYDSKLSSDDRAAVVSYLQTKYAL